MQTTPSFDAAVASVPILRVKISLRVSRQLARLALLFHPVLLAAVNVVPLSQSPHQFKWEAFGSRIFDDAVGLRWRGRE